MLEVNVGGFTASLLAPRMAVEATLLLGGPAICFRETVLKFLPRKGNS